MTDQEKQAVLDEANLPDDLKKKCYVSDDSIIFTPTSTETAEQVYQRWLKAKNAPQTPVLTTEEKLEELIKEYNDIKTRMANTEEAIIGLMSTN